MQRTLANYQRHLTSPEDAAAAAAVAQQNSLRHGDTLRDWVDDIVGK